MNNQEIHDICKEYGIVKYIINPDGSIDVDGDVDLSDMNLTELSIKFNRVSGSFYCYSNNLKTLKGSPNYVGGDFSCSLNNLTSLEGSPEIIYGTFYCGGNPLESFEGYNSSYDKIINTNKEKLVRKTKLKILDIL